MKRIQIGESRREANKYKQDAKSKIQLLSQARKIAEGYITIDSLKDFQDGFQEYIYKQLDEASNGSFSSLSLEKVFALHDVSGERLKNIERQYKKLSHIELINNFTEAADRDQFIYAESSEEHKRLKQFNILKEAEEKLIKEGFQPNYFHLTRSLYPLTEMSGTALKVNVHYVKTGKLTH